MQHVALAALATAVLVASQSPANACDQAQVMNPHFLTIPINGNNYAAIAKSALVQAAALQPCIAQSSGHSKTQYLLMRAVALSTAAQAMDNMPEADRAAEARYSKEAIAIARPIANDPNALDRERRGAQRILKVSGWLKKTG